MQFELFPIKSKSTRSLPAACAQKSRQAIREPSPCGILLKLSVRNCTFELEDRAGVGRDTVLRARFHGHRSARSSELQSSNACCSNRSKAIGSYVPKLPTNSS